MCKAADLLLSQRVEETSTYYFKVQTVNCVSLKAKTGGCPIFDGRVRSTRKAAEVQFVTVNSNTPGDQAESSMSCYRVITLYIHALDT